MKQMKHLLKLVVPAIALAGALGASSIAQAGPLTVSDYLIVRDPTGGTIAYTGITELDEILNPAAIMFVNVPIDPTQFGNPITLTEPDPANPGQIFFSDIVGIADLGPGIGLVLAFNSDSEDAGAVFAGIGTLVPETDREIDVSRFLDPALRAAGFTAAFLSYDVPEPTSLALLGTGLIGLAARARKRKAV